MAHAVEQFGGVVQAYMGDGIAAFFGVPGPTRTIPSGLPEPRSRSSTWCRSTPGGRTAWRISDFNVRVGINTGETAVGLVGGASPQSVSIGDTANVAARLQSVAAPGAIVVGEATAKR